jgi:hypothetical protein
MLYPFGRFNRLYKQFVMVIQIDASLGRERKVFAKHVLEATRATFGRIIKRSRNLLLLFKGQSADLLKNRLSSGAHLTKVR